MLVKLWLVIDTKDRTNSAQAEKTVRTGFTLTPGMMVEDLAWKDARAAKSVFFSTDAPDTLSVFMGYDDPSSVQFRQVVEMYRAHGWTVKVYGQEP